MRYVLSRIGQAAIVVCVISVGAFFALRLTAGDPARIRGQVFTQESVLQSYREQFGTDKPIIVQLFNTIGGMFRGDFGTSFRYEVPVLDILLPALGNTLLLGGIALAISFVLATVLGTLSARYPTSLIARFSSLLAIVGQSAPLFWVSLLLISLFAMNLGWFPPGGLDSWKSLVLPVTALTLSILPSQMRVLISGVRKELGEDYVRSARAFGLSESKIGFVYVYRNAVLPLMTVIGVDMGTVLGGVIVAEMVFNYPGLGSVALNAMNARDYPLIQGVTIIAAVTFVLINLIVDLLYTVVNPRVRLGKAA
ncbi:ABC transporter permease [Leucobacter sp. UT-8R-CII-1-4]|uniref:ABC transporter permease n=1 Tax=Leucobacter sp. UT-8R-CII-1-4 TaxID=3040075 RepID=UPI0024A8994C|nr:ABC transporter permease [Leucobacter sp. UT-8R-CII-1-4]MDI6023672.1 ABC transporter permease [Leucobacter sp. UT-8R-CII-1-4]